MTSFILGFSFSFIFGFQLQLCLQFVGLISAGGVAKMSPLMTGWPCRYLFHFYFGQRIKTESRKQATYQKATEVARSQGSLARHLFRSPSGCLFSLLSTIFPSC